MKLVLSYRSIGSLLVCSFVATSAHASAPGFEIFGDECVEVSSPGERECEILINRPKIKRTWQSLSISYRLDHISESFVAPLADSRSHIHFMHYRQENPENRNRLFKESSNEFPG